MQNYIRCVFLTYLLEYELRTSLLRNKLDIESARATGGDLQKKQNKKQTNL